MSGERATEWTREYPQRPIVGVAGVVVDGSRVLLVRRGRAPALGAWSLPGSALRVGERLQDGVAREVWEETGQRVLVMDPVATLDRIVHDAAGMVQFHYVLLDWLCRVDGAAQEPTAGGDATDARWVERDALRSMDGLDDTAVDLIELVMERERSRT